MFSVIIFDQENTEKHNFSQTHYKLIAYIFQLIRYYTLINRSDREPYDGVNNKIDLFYNSMVLIWSFVKISNQKLPISYKWHKWMYN